MLYGWNKFDGYYYYSYEDGTIAKGETYIDGEKYCFDEDTGKMYRTATAIVGGKLWYFDDHGVKVFGIVELDGKKYCFSEKGNLKKGLQIIDGKTYYFETKGEWMAFGYRTINGKTYYFGDDGAAVTGTVEIDGVICTFDENGVLQN